MAQRHEVPHFPKLKRSAGMTLMEVLVALVVMGVAVSVILFLFTASLTVGQLSRNKKVAAALAEEQMDAVLHNAAAYDWSGLRTAPVGGVAEVKPSADSPDVAFPPSVMPLDRQAYNRETNFYEGFTGQVFAKLPAAEAAYVEVTVVIRWDEKNPSKLFALTSCVPRTVVEGTT